MKKILYLGYYDIPENKPENRNYVLAATNKMTYICSAINRAGWDVEIVSASGSKNREGCPGKIVEVSPHTTLRLFPSMGTGRKPKRVLSLILGQLRLFWYLFCHTKRGEPVLAYHSLGYVRLLWLLKRIKGFRLILEVEEIYSDVTGNERTRAREMRLFRNADSFIFPTELLDEYLNTENKPSIIIYGTYQVEADRQCNFEGADLQGKTHLLYAGTFDPRKGGAQAAAAAAGHLPENHHVHIIGFGSEQDTKDMKDVVAKVAKESKATVTYDGLLSGEDYIRFVQSCHVGFSTQMPDAAFNETSFPSKVLSYLANGLRVVSIRIKALEKSEISSLLYYYDENTPEAIAEAVASIDFSQKYDSRETIKRLDKRFVREIGVLLNVE